MQLCPVDLASPWTSSAKDAMSAIESEAAHMDSASAGASYGQREYWEDRYFRELRASTSQYEWYVGYEALRTILRWHIPLHAAVLQVGVGTSSLQLEMALDGYEHLHNIDYSQVLIEHMQREHEGIPQLSYELADCRHMPHIASESFDAVIDKGTLDAILCLTSSFDHVPSTLLECARVLQPGGAFIMITYGPPERRLGPLTSITLPWDVAVYALRQADGQGEVVRRAADSPPGALSLGPFAQHQAAALKAMTDQHGGDWHYVYICTKRQPLAQ